MSLRLHFFGCVTRRTRRVRMQADVLVTFWGWKLTFALLPASLSFVFARVLISVAPESSGHEQVLAQHKHSAPRRADRCLRRCQDGLDSQRAQLQGVGLPRHESAIKGHQPTSQLGDTIVCCLHHLPSRTPPYLLVSLEACHL